MSTAFGYCSQAAHIRGLGRHGGPDEPANVLCLCANCHVEFDNFALYVDEDGVVRRVRDRSSVGELRRHPEHAVDERHLAYHRELCVIGPPPA
ncbi:HNH endonuclease [Saccharothrix syringae]|uniref:HNH endonuclease n=2 Tax=Saccharothrix syringae TaxID=103733 RepID=A0A5Q0HFT4_SACSY|nr:HNH endonuclease [Saccharothrix syringae]